MAKQQEVVFSEFIQGKIEAALGKLEGDRIPLSEAIGRLIDPIDAALRRGVSEKDVLEVLKRNGMAVNQTTLRKLVKEGR